MEHHSLVDVSGLGASKRSRAMIRLTLALSCSETVQDGSERDPPSEPPERDRYCKWAQSSPVLNEEFRFERRSMGAHYEPETGR